MHAAESCSECGTRLAGGWVQRTREVIELPLAPAEVIEHVFVARMCAICRQRCLPQGLLQGLAVGRQRFGINLMSLIVTLREEGRLPIRSIQQYLQTVHQLKLSVGAIVETIHTVARLSRPAVAGMVERIRGSPVLSRDTPCQPIVPKVQHFQVGQIAQLGRDAPRQPVAPKVQHLEIRQIAQRSRDAPRQLNPIQAQHSFRQ